MNERRQPSQTVFDNFNGKKVVEIIEENSWLWLSTDEKLDTNGAINVREAMEKIGEGPVDLVIVGINGEGLLISDLTCDPDDWSFVGKIDRDQPQQLCDGKMRVSLPKRLILSGLGSDRTDDYRDRTTGGRSTTSHWIRIGRTFEQAELVQVCVIGVLRSGSVTSLMSKGSKKVAFNIAE